MITKKALLTGGLSGLVLICGAQEKKAKLTVLSDIKFSGYIMTQYQYSGQHDAESNSFNIRMGRLALEGRVLKDFYWKAQLQVNGNTSTLGTSPRVVDLFIEWQRFSPFKVKVGQFKRPFTFENPMHPIDQGFMSYAQSVTKLAGFSDRSGEHSSNGRDIGIQLQGDLLKNASGRNLLHYQVGVFNGQGINEKDVDQRKDVIGGIWVMPIPGMRIGAFGWTGSYSRKGTWNESTPSGQVVERSGKRSLAKNRYAISAEYKANDWTFRSEYIHSQGYAFKTTYQKSTDTKDCTLNTAIGDKADGVYALVIAPIVKNRIHAKVRYDLYRPSAIWTTAKTLYEVGADYEFSKNLKLSAEYAFVNDRSLSKHNYNMVDVEFDVRF